MIRTVEAVIDEQGRVRLLEDLVGRIDRERRGSPNEVAAARPLAPVRDFLAPAQLLDVRVDRRVAPDLLRLRRLGLRHDVAQRIGGRAVPVRIERLDDVRHDRPERQHV